MRLSRLILLLLTSGMVMTSCTKRDNKPPVEKPDRNNDNAAVTKDDDDDKEVAPDYSGRERAKSAETEPESASTSETDRYLKLINGWSGKEDIHPSGLKFYTRAFEEAPEPSTSPTSTPSGANSTGSANATGTYAAMVAEFRSSGCLANCHTVGGSAASRPLDDHSRMVSNGSAAGWVSGAAASVTSGRMPRGSSLAAGARTAMANSIDAKVRAWVGAGMPAQ